MAIARSDPQPPPATCDDVRVPTAATVTAAIAIAACAAGALIALAMWRQRAGAARASQLRHPATPPPVTVAVDTGNGARRWRLAVDATAPPTAIDIVTWRIRDGDQPWRSEAIVQPIEIAPGGWALAPGDVPVAGAFDVVVAWTNHTPAGDVEGSRTFRVDGRATPRTAGPPTQPVRQPTRWPLAETTILAGLVAAAVAVAVTWVDGAWGGPDPVLAPPIAPSTVPTTMPAIVPSTAPATPVPVVSAAPTLPPATTAPPTTSPPATGPPSTVAPSTTQATSTAAPPTTGATTTTAPTSGPTTGPRVEIAATIDQCGSSPNCLVASFSIVGFDSAPTEYVCEFGDGERLAFGFGGDEVARACSTGSADASITIEVDGVRSATVTRADAE